MEPRDAADKVPHQIINWEQMTKNVNTLLTKYSTCYNDGMNLEETARFGFSSTFKIAYKTYNVEQDHLQQHV